MSIALRCALVALAITAVASYAPAGPDNLTADEAAAVQKNLDRFLSLFDSLAGAPGNNKELCQSWVADTFMPVRPKFTHPPPIGPVQGLDGLFGFCDEVRNISKVQEMRQDGPYTWVATAANHTHLDVLLPGVYMNDAPFAKTFHLVFKMVKSMAEHPTTVFKIQEGSEILTTTQSNYTFPSN